MQQSAVRASVAVSVPKAREFRYLAAYSRPNRAPAGPKSQCKCKSAPREDLSSVYRVSESIDPRFSSNPRKCYDCFELGLLFAGLICICIAIWAPLARDLGESKLPDTEIRVPWERIQRQRRRRGLRTAACISLVGCFTMCIYSLFCPKDCTSRRAALLLLHRLPAHPCMRYPVLLVREDAKVSHTL